MFKRQSLPYIYLLFLFFSLTISCTTHRTDPLLYANYDTRAVAEPQAGTYILRVQGKGMSKDAAKTSAKQKAVRDIIFTDVHCTFNDHKPLMRLIIDPSVEKKAEDVFFNSFFSQKGDYNQYVKLLSKDQEFYSEGKYTTCIVYAEVNRASLKEHLQLCGLVK